MSLRASPSARLTRNNVMALSRPWLVNASALMPLSSFIALLTGRVVLRIPSRATIFAQWQKKLVYGTFNGKARGGFATASFPHRTSNAEMPIRLYAATATTPLWLLSQKKSHFSAAVHAADTQPSRPSRNRHSRRREIGCNMLYAS